MEISFVEILGCMQVIRKRDYIESRLDFDYRFNQGKYKIFWENLLLCIKLILFEFNGFY